MAWTAEDLLDDLARRIGGVVLDALRGDRDPHWVDQTDSPLGPRLHCRAVRRRLAEGAGGAQVLSNRKHLLTREALQEEMAGSPRPGGGGPKPGLRKCGPLPAPAAGLTPGAQATLSRLRLIRTQQKGK